ncbi:tRNA (adenosine(37)-N6)-dimethylallyltransferase MiaA [Spiribacter vilamensis]|uniref:tRNA dimethylallyltransferase n=1 Tax=Spiribacter vilamensis TaxID=531306 RepID=A0A4Q8D0X0_9GAMM|nr:tRNA (adenosine(37)-N6)-dimethylallyltransferase MiaA [Spiribacter vilamensis]RZU98958.1 tRNA dimethylallyltransferase [Spiribacter vilamensis]TVO62032.1 tRNA (adenosine(37)-N6)-dimethylallyltransferase MiaA [Spiribacter vilamensis]
MEAASLPVVCLMGPTAAGKTDLALSLHERGGVDLISVDSAMVYRGLDIGTAKPSPAVQARAPHALIDIRDPAQAYSAADFVADARPLIEASRQAGRIPVLVGGTMLYFRSLLYGLSRLPAADAGIRARLEAEAARLGWPALHERLAQADPDTAARLHRNDAQRIQRALEVYELSGQPISRLQADAGQEPLSGPVVRVGVMPAERRILHERIEARFAAMLADGVIDEVAGLRARADIHPDLPSMRAVGYRQIWGYLDGRIARDELHFRGTVATRQFARRQVTWLRREADLAWLDPLENNPCDRLSDLINRVVA